MKAVACAIAMMARRSERNLFIVIILYYVRYILVDYYLLWYNLLMLPSLPVLQACVVDGCRDRRENCGSARIDDAETKYVCASLLSSSRQITTRKKLSDSHDGNLIYKGGRCASLR